MTKWEIIYEYEQLLVGNVLDRDFKKLIGSSGLKQELVVGIIWRFAITELLGWTPEEAHANLNKTIVQSLKLNATYDNMQYGNALAEVNNYDFVLQYAFPEKIKYNFTKATLMEYKRFAKEEQYSHDKKKSRKPKSFFVGAIGEKRARICFNYAVNRYLGHMTVPQKYDFFANTSKAKKWMKQHSLDSILILHYPDPLTCFHFLGYLKYPFENAELYYYEHLGRILLEKSEKEAKKKKRETALTNKE